MKIYANHFCLNMGYAASMPFRMLNAMVHVLVPPQLTGHSAREMQELSAMGFSPFYFFFQGLYP
jgi:hypothetical protein